ncbi:hypothetical protein H5410_026448 [Solanum commersonii]|uniref:Uncharacterized protein n=1 Tax=Solanum commersonii TaxID=4109 RepID=A0A9J5Z0R6_SOLCO|nr:hypothetical protein H5410_026448 [Solanum commersonii]
MQQVEQPLQKLDDMNPAGYVQCVRAPIKSEFMLESPSSSLTKATNSDVLKELEPETQTMSSTKISTSIKSQVIILEV